MKKIIKRLLLVLAALSIMTLAGCSENPNNYAADANHSNVNTPNTNKSVTDKATGAVGGAVETGGEAVKGAAETTGNAVETGAEKTGDAVETGAEKTGDALETAGEAVGNTVK